MICGEGIGLRPVLEQDLSLIAHWQDKDLSSPMFYSLALVSETALRGWLKALLGDSTRIRFMVQVLETGVTLGMIGLEHIDYRNQAAELAGLFIDSSQGRRGWGTKATQSLIRYAFEDLNLHRLSARVHTSNRAAQRVAERAGLRCEGIAREAVFRNGAYDDVVFMSILREEQKHE